MTMSKAKQPAKATERIADFDPEIEDLSAQCWLEKVEEFARINRFSEDQMYCLARGKLAGAAKEWLVTAEVGNWQDFRTALQEVFGSASASKATSRKHRALERRKKLANETISEYIEVMVQLGKRQKLPEPSIVRHIVAGLGDPVLTKVLPRGTSLMQLRKAIDWQTEIGKLMRQYNDSELGVESFERLADKLESFVLDSGEDLMQLVAGETEVLKTITVELRELLKQYRSAVSCSLFDLGTCRTHQIVVHLDDGPPVFQDIQELDKNDSTRALQTSVISHLTCDVILKYTEDHQHLRPAKWPPVQLLNGTELWLDLAHLNARCSKESPNFLLPQPLLSALPAFRYFTLLDFNAGHLQIPIAVGSRHHFTFTTPSFGEFQFARAPSNFANTTIIFHKILIELTRRLHPGDAVVLHDTLLVPSQDTAEGLCKLARVFAGLTGFGLTLDIRRSRFFLKEVRLFNWIVRQGKVISTGLPFEPSHSASRRLTLLIKVASSSAGPQSWLLVGGCKETDREAGIGPLTTTVGHYCGHPASTLEAHLLDSIEHFRHFLLFTRFEIVLQAASTKLQETAMRRALLQVQQFDFVIKIGNLPRDVDDAEAL